MDSQIIVKEVISHTATNEAFTFSLFHNAVCSIPVCSTPVACDEHRYQHELFLDMDVRMKQHRDLPELESCGEPGNAALLPESSEFSPEFEFRIALSNRNSVCSGVMEAFSPADDLFYKGCLLPLHLPPRQRMLQSLSSTEAKISADNEEDEDFCAASIDNANAKHILAVAELGSDVSLSVHPDSCCGDDDRHCCNGLALQVSSPALCINTREDEHDVFPECYKDPAIQIIRDNRRHRDSEKASSFSRRSSRPSIGCSVLLSSSRRLGCVEDFTGKDGTSHNLHVQNYKHAEKTGFPMIKINASTSLLRSVFNLRELRGFLVYRGAHHRVYQDSPICLKEEEEEEAAEEDDGGDGEEAGLDRAPSALKVREAHERDRILRRAKVYIQKYMKRVKSMYILLSQTHPEQSRNLLESSNAAYEKSMCSLSLSSSSSSRIRQGSDSSHTASKIIRNNAPSEMKSESKHRKCGDAIPQQEGVITTKIYSQSAMTTRSRLLQELSCRSASSVEVESPIQGAIAHCKQSSTLYT